MSDSIRLKSVLFSEEKLGPYGMGVIQLNRPEALNALTLEMFHLIRDRLEHWRTRDDIVVIFIHAKGDKAFCAGGDVKLICQNVLNDSRQGLEFAKEYFTTEYLIDDLVFTYEKPVIAWTHGLTFGGGLGLIYGSLIRVATETTSVAMPEVSIGFFADVGAQFFLQKLNLNCGLFLALSGARIDGATAVGLGLFNHFVPAAKKRKVMTDLLRLPWTKSPDKNRGVCAYYFNSFEKPLVNLRDLVDLEKFAEAKSLVEYDERLREWFEEHADWKIAQKTYTEASPLSQRLIFDYFREGRGKNHRQCLLRDWDLAIKLCDKGAEQTDFIEGVRAQLIHKTRDPKWVFPDIKSVPDKVVDEVLHTSQPALNGLAHELGINFMV